MSLLDVIFHACTAFGEKAFELALNVAPLLVQCFNVTHDHQVNSIFSLIGKAPLATYLYHRMSQLGDRNSKGEGRTLREGDNPKGHFYGDVRTRAEARRLGNPISITKPASCFWRPKG